MGGYWGHIGGDIGGILRGHLEGYLGGYLWESNNGINDNLLDNLKGITLGDICGLGINNGSVFSRCFIRFWADQPIWNPIGQTSIVEPAPKNHVLK